MRTFLVECYWPSIGADAVRSTERVSRMAARYESRCSIRWLGCILLPSDGLTLFLLKAENEVDVKAFAHIAEMPFDRVIEAIQIEPDA